jgi:hypothetical protein
MVAAAVHRRSTYSAKDAPNPKTVRGTYSSKGAAMLLPHAFTLTQARSFLAALADQASTIDASSAYEHVLTELDRVHGDECPAINGAGLTADRAILLAVATSALEELEQYGVDPLSVELILAMLDDAYALDGT